jgi:menaquinone-dependent protoporphyrinogen oxidase
MNALVTYASRLGSTAEIAEHIAARLRDRGVDSTILPVDASPAVATFDAVVIGSALYAGHWLDDATHFVRENEQDLRERPVWAFSSGPVGKAASGETHAPSAVRALVARIGARDHRVFAGAFDPTTVDAAQFAFIERVVAKRFVPQGDFRKWSQIDAWADDIAHSILGTRPTPSIRTTLAAATSQKGQEGV